MFVSGVGFTVGWFGSLVVLFEDSSGGGGWDDGMGFWWYCRFHLLLGFGAYQRV